jgi:hypothetical protein
VSTRQASSSVGTKIAFTGGGFIAGVVATIATILMLARSTVVERSEYNRILAEVETADPTKVRVFTSVKSCISKGFSSDQCQLSDATAHEAALSIAPELAFPSKDACQAVHGDHCVLLEAPDFYKRERTDREFWPELIGFQVFADTATKELQPQKSIPIFPTPLQGFGCRSNRTQVTLTLD